MQSPPSVFRFGSIDPAQALSAVEFVTDLNGSIALGDLAGLTEGFLPEVVFEGDGERLQGEGAIRRIVEMAIADHDRPHDVSADHAIDRDGDDVVIRYRRGSVQEHAGPLSLADAIEGRNAPAGSAFSARVVIHDRLRWTGEGWKIAERRVEAFQSVAR